MMHTDINLQDKNNHGLEIGRSNWQVKYSQNIKKHSFSQNTIQTYYENKHFDFNWFNVLIFLLEHVFLCTVIAQVSWTD